MRIDLAVELAGKEIAKILNVKNDRDLQDIRLALKNMYDGREGVYAPVHDFWSLVEMVLHVKKKELPELITAENVKWREECVPINDLALTWMPFLEQNKSIFGEKPWSVANVQSVFAESPHLLEEAKNYQLKVVGKKQHKFNQSHEPIEIMKENESYRLVDGNGRLYHAVLNGQDTIQCYVGEMKGSVPANYWASSGSLKQLCLELRAFRELDQEAFNAGAVFLKAKLQHNTTALINYEIYLRKDFPELEEAIADVLPSNHSETKLFR